MGAASGYIHLDQNTNEKGSMPNQHNQAQVKILLEKVSRAKSMAIVDYSGTGVNDQVALRRQLKAVNGEFFVTKNTLIDIALGKDQYTDSLNGMNGVVFSFGDEVSAIKELFAFQKTSEKLTIKQGWVEGKVLSADQVKALSQMPGKTELISMLLARLQSPGQGMVNVLKATQRNLVYALQAIADKKAETPAADTAPAA